MFVVCYATIASLSLSRKLTKDTIATELKLYKVQHMKGQSFTFIYYWLILKNVPRWASFCDKLWRPLYKPSIASKGTCKVEIVEGEAFNLRWRQFLKIMIIWHYSLSPTTNFCWKRPKSISNCNNLRNS
jgi:hypothetical protein